MPPRSPIFANPCRWVRCSLGLVLLGNGGQQWPEGEQSEREKSEREREREREREMWNIELKEWESQGDS